jgi:HEAT repeat protein
MSVLSRPETGDGIPALIELSRGSADGWLATHAMRALARSGDPRSRQYLRTAAQRTDLPDEVQATVLAGIGGEYATGSDAAFLRDRYRSLQGDRSREAVVSALAGMGGAENARWLLGVARDADQPMRARQRAVQLAEKAGVPPQELVRLYDQVDEREVREALLSAFAQIGTRATTDKLLAVAKSDTDVALRRRAVSHMSRSQDPRVRQALREIVERP